MKLSLSWIFDHINADWRAQNIDQILTKFNQITAEIEHVYQLKIHIDNIFAVVTASNDTTKAFIPELQQEITLPNRSLDLLSAQTEKLTFLVKRTGSSFTWATLADFGGEKGGLVPALNLTQEQINGSWRSLVTSDDIILEVDNKSITHRPDMWGHRGFAREIAAFLSLPLKPAHDFLTMLPIEQYETSSPQSSTMPIGIHNQTPEACFGFNGLYISSFENKASHLFFAARLMAVDGRPMNSIIDLTNYLTMDWGQPSHAYDATRIHNNQINIRKAKAGETLHLLDGEEILLTPNDLIIADNVKPLCLAGVKGGRNDSVSASTTAIFFEAANFDASTVRRSALHHKTRTDSSARFEKTLDPNLATEAVFRFINLLECAGIDASYAAHIVKIGAPVKSSSLDITHTFLCQRSGIALSADEVVNLLTPLEFNVTVKHTEPLTYTITIPTFRSSKDIKIKEDILEEVMRTYGFQNIKHTLPPMQREAFDTSKLQRIRAARRYLAHGARMMEQKNYALFDETFIKQLAFNPEKTINLVNPMSENHYRLVTSLIPGLLKNITENMVHQDNLAFFEIGRVWKNNLTKPHEQITISGILFDKRKSVDFYTGKEYVNELFKVAGFNKTITWNKSNQHELPWWHTYQSANLTYNNQPVGIAGMLNPMMLDKIGGLPESSAFIFEIDGSFLTSHEQVITQYQTLSRFQETFFDLSLVVPLSIRCKTLEEKLSSISTLITSVTLIDFYEGKGEANTRAMTFRVWLQHMEHTLEKEEIDQVYHQAVQAIEQAGVQLRS